MDEEKVERVRYSNNTVDALVFEVLHAGVEYRLGVNVVRGGAPELTDTEVGFARVAQAKSRFPLSDHDNLVATGAFAGTNIRSAACYDTVAYTCYRVISLVLAKSKGDNPNLLHVLSYHTGTYVPYHIKLENK